MTALHKINEGIASLSVETLHGINSGFIRAAGNVFEAGNQSHGSIREFLQYIAARTGASTPTAGGTLTINSQSLGSYDYVIKEGDQTVSSFSNGDWFTNTADSRSAIIVVKGNLTINAAQVFRPSNRKLFTAIYVTGNLAISGEISMSQRGANHGTAGSNISAAAIRIATGTFSTVVNPQVPAAGANGAAAVGNAAGNPGSAGTDGQTGGGGGGSGAGTVSESAGTGAAGTSFSGGSGGGGRNSGTGSSAEDAAVNGGKGGDAVGGNSGGGAGNPGGALAGSGTAGADGTGGVLFIFTVGQLSGAGSITAAGAVGGEGSGGGNGANGGGSGGGSVTVMYGTDTSSITPTALGGLGGQLNGRDGGTGGNGTARKLAL